MRLIPSYFIRSASNYFNYNLNICKTYCILATNQNHDTVEKASKYRQNPIETEKHRTLRIAVVGVPNAGKSSFINNLINHRVCPTSSKVHTTRKSNKAIYTQGNAQLIFYDTPGLVTQREIKKHNLEKTFKSAYRHAIQHANLIAVVHDVSNCFTRNELHPTVLDTLNEYSSLPSVLILNKIDTLKSKRILLELIRVLTNNTLSQKTLKEKSALGYVSKTNANTKIIEKRRNSGWNHFVDVFLVSSITCNGLADVNEYFLNTAKDSDWEYTSETFTDAKPENLIVDSVQARLLDYLPQEIPYSLKSIIEYYSEEKNTIYASVQVVCPTSRIERLICGESNGKIRQITERVTSDLVETFGKPISLTISTSIKKKESV